MQENNILTHELDDDGILRLVLNDSRRCNTLSEANLRNLGAALAEAGKTPAEISGDVVTHPATLCNYTWEKHCGGLYELPVAA